MKKILIVEDEKALQTTLGGALSKAGFTVVSAFDGDEGLIMAQGEKPDLILLDLILPKRNGFDTLEALKKDAATANVPVMVLTNLEGTTDVDRAISLGATTYLVKANYEIADVIAKIRHMLGQAV